MWVSAKRAGAGFAYPGWEVLTIRWKQVSSQQMHEIRASLRGQGVVLMGKNTMVRRAIRVLLSDFPEYERLLPHVKGKQSDALSILPFTA